MLSIKEGRRDLAKYFMSLVNGSVNGVDRYNKTCLMYAAENGFHEIVASLIEKGADVNIVDKSGRTALTYAAKNQ